MLHSINRPNFIIWLTLLLEIFIAIVCDQAVTFKIWNLSGQDVLLHHQKIKTKT